MRYEAALQDHATRGKDVVLYHMHFSLWICVLDAELFDPERFVSYSVTRFPPDGIVKRKNPPCASRVQTTVSVKKASSSAMLRVS